VEDALRSRPADPLVGAGGEALFQLASQITGDALASAPSAKEHATIAPGAQTGVVEHIGGREAIIIPDRGQKPKDDDRLVLVEDDPRHETDEVVVVNRSFCFYGATLNRDGAEVAGLKDVLVERTALTSFVQVSAAFPPVGLKPPDRRRTLPVGNGKLGFRFRKDRDANGAYILMTLLSGLIGVSASIPAGKDVRAVLATLSQASSIHRDFLLLLEKFKNYATASEVIRDLAAFVAAKAVILEAALHPYLEQSLSKPYLEMLLKVASKKLLFALGAGYYGADLLATIWCHTHQPDQLGDAGGGARARLRQGDRGRGLGTPAAGRQARRGGVGEARRAGGVLACLV
jgi:hypothetical protein